MLINKITPLKIINLKLLNLRIMMVSWIVYLLANSCHKHRELKYKIHSKNFQLKKRPWKLRILNIKKKVNKTRLCKLMKLTRSYLMKKTIKSHPSLYWSLKPYWIYNRQILLYLKQETATTKGLLLTQLRKLRLMILSREPTSTPLCKTYLVGW